ncbi:universal stress protein [Brevundimonas sp.]|uniref:universal stress protein n=1 Tax=Brevundimonas sp. TaxID=1871086 RepID=UPI0027378749|nr:universal stress protein [Brevundimonas sp.]MDP3802320.1 universal stress protein [Brevundimonas sp.]
MENPERRIVVCLDGSSRSDQLGRQAAALARRLGARLIGLRGLHRPFPSPPETFARGAGAIHEVLEHQAQQEQALVAAARRAFDALVQPYGAPADFRPAWDDDPDVTGFATAGDLIVVGHPRLPGLSEALSADRLLLRCARPVLIVPTDWTRSIGNRVLIGWNGSRAARQAAEDALPLIAADARATILLVDQAAPAETAAELAASLRVRGVDAAVKTLDSGAASVAGTIIEAADEWAADLIVLGGYSRSPTVEKVFGGVTRSLLGAVTRPLLLSHLPHDLRRTIDGDRGAAHADEVSRPSSG